MILTTIIVGISITAFVVSTVSVFTIPVQVEEFLDSLRINSNTE